MQYKMSVISTSTKGIEYVSNILIINGIGGFEVCDSRDFQEFLDTREPAYDYVDDQLMQLCRQRSCIKFYTALNSQGDDIISAVEKSLADLKEQDNANELGTLELNVTLVDDSDWKDNWKKYYHPLEIGEDLIISPAWENVRTGKKLLKIDPGMAFGTGSHETTALCLEFIYAQDLKGKIVMDVGCGSGILSQAAVLLGADFAYGCDIDQAAVQAAQANAKLNGLESKTAYYRGDLLEFANDKYDIVIANIVADVIKTLVLDLSKVLKSGGVFIASGIICEREREVSDCINSNGFDILEIKERRGWAAILAVLK